MDDIKAIHGLVAGQFKSLTWTAGVDGDWSGFEADFVNGAQLFPAARPVQRQTVDEFVQRMQGLRKTSLKSLNERLLGMHVRVFGNVAIAMVGCELTENDDHVNRGAEALLLVKSDGIWRIAAQAWDMEGEANKLPEELASSGTE